MPFVMSISSKQSCFDVYCIIHTHLHSVVGSRYLTAGPDNGSIRKKIIVSDNRNKFGKFDDWYWKYDETEKQYNTRRWKNLRKRRNFELLLLPNRYYQFLDPGTWPNMIPDDEKTNFYQHCIEDDDDGKVNEICIAIKWTEPYRNNIEALKRFKKSLNTIYVGGHY